MQVRSVIVITIFLAILSMALVAGMADAKSFDISKGAVVWLNKSYTPVIIHHVEVTVQDSPTVALRVTVYLHDTNTPGGYECLGWYVYDKAQSETHTFTAPEPASGRLVVAVENIGAADTTAIVESREYAQN
ncbi:MAG TPA: hypothetical protein VGJ92_05860 [Methanocella sp.]